MIEELISKQELETVVLSEKRFADLTEKTATSEAFAKVLRIIGEQKVMGYVNPTQFVFYGGDRE